MCGEQSPVQIIQWGRRTRECVSEWREMVDHGRAGGEEDTGKSVKAALVSGSGRDHR